MPYLNESEEPSGFVEVLTEDNKLNYQRRFAIINIHGRKMYFYKNDPKEHPNESCTHFLDLKKASNVDEWAEDFLPPYVFYITIDGKDTHIRAKDKRDRDDWIKIIKDLIKILPLGKKNSSVIRPLLMGLNDPAQDDIVNDVKGDRCSSINIEDEKEKDHNNRISTQSCICICHNSIVKEGYCQKVGNSYKTWKSRYFILNKHGLSYYKTKEDNKNLLRLIEYDEIQDCLKSNGVYPKKENLFEVRTAKRTYYIQTESSELENWIRLIKANKECFKKQSDFSVGQEDPDEEAVLKDNTSAKKQDPNFKESSLLSATL